MSTIPSLVVYIAVVFAGIGNAGCRSEISGECEEYYAQPAYERSHAFRAYPIDKQLNIYRCGMQRRPPEFGLAAYIAEGGEKNIALILDRLKSEKDEPTKVGMFFIFELMSQKEYFRKRQDVIEQLKQVVASMQSKTGREQAGESLQKILNNGSS